MDKEKYLQEFESFVKFAPRDINCLMHKEYPKIKMKEIEMDFSKYDSILTIGEIETIINSVMTENNKIKEKNKITQTIITNYILADKLKWLKDMAELISEHCTILRENTNTSYLSILLDYRDIYNSKETNIYAVLRDYFYYSLRLQNMSERIHFNEILDVKYSDVLSKLDDLKDTYSFNHYPSNNPIMPLSEYLFTNKKLAQLTYEQAVQQYNLYKLSKSKEVYFSNQLFRKEKEHRLAILTEYFYTFKSAMGIEISYGFFLKHINKDVLAIHLKNNIDMEIHKKDFHVFICESLKPLYRDVKFLAQ